MTTPMDALQSGLRPADREMLDFSRSPVIKQARDPSRNLMTKEQAAAGVSTSPAALPPIPAAAVPQSSGQANPGLSSSPAGTIPPVTIPSTPPATAAPPLFPGDSPRVQDRINKLFGRAKSAEERAAEAESRLADLMNRVEARLGGPSGPPAAPGYPPMPYPNAQLPMEPGPLGQAESAGAGQPITRAELAHLLQMQTRMFMEHNALTNAHSVSRAEAERDFPDVFSNPALKAAADQIWASDPGLKRDPMGPYKAAILARGLYGPSAGASPSVASQATAQKEALSAVGATVPEGPAQPDDRQARYDAAMARARATGREEDAALARLIAMGVA